MDSTVLLYAVEELPALTHMYAPCVDQLLTEHKHVQLEHFFPLSTPLHVNRWKTALHHAGALDKFAEVSEGLCTGFSMGLDSFCIDKTFIPWNHYKSSEAHDFIILKYFKEIDLGQVSPAFILKQAELLFGPICTASLNVISSAGGKQRVMVNLSYPWNDSNIASINSIIDSSSFQCDWGTFANCWLLVSDFSLGTQVAIFDVESAFWIILTRLCDWPFLVVSIDGLIHFDFRLNFGAACSPGIFGHIADTIVQIFLHSDVNAVLK